MSESFDDGELEATAEELEQARRLQEALERGNAGDDREIERLVETARLVEVSRRFELSPERQQVPRTELVEAFERQTRRRLVEAPRAPLLRRLALWFPLPLAAAAAFVFLIRQQHAPREAALVTELTEAAAPRLSPADGARFEPSSALLRAQALALAEAFGPVVRGEAKQGAVVPGARGKQESDEAQEPVAASAERGDAAATRPSPARAELERELSLHRAGLMAALDAKLR